jgi:hypothetical protein
MRDAADAVRGDPFFLEKRLDVDGSLSSKQDIETVAARGVRVRFHRQCGAGIGQEHGRQRVQHREVGGTDIAFGKRKTDFSLYRRRFARALRRAERTEQKQQTAGDEKSADVFFVEKKECPRSGRRFRSEQRMCFGGRYADCGCSHVLLKFLGEKNV